MGKAIILKGAASIPSVENCMLLRIKPWRWVSRVLPGLGTKVTSLGQKLGASYVGDSYLGDGDMVHVNQKWLAADKAVCFSPPV